jgi:hypothetical protein
MTLPSRQPEFAIVCQDMRFLVERTNMGDKKTELEIELMEDEPVQESKMCGRCQ